MTKVSYMPLGAGYSYAALRNGMTVRNAAGKEIYIQPGDNEAAMRANFSALDEISLDITDRARNILADMLLSEYF